MSARQDKLLSEKIKAAKKRVAEQEKVVELWHAELKHAIQQKDLASENNIQHFLLPQADKELAEKKLELESLLNMLPE